MPKLHHQSIMRLRLLTLLLRPRGEGVVDVVVVVVGTEVVLVGAVLELLPQPWASDITGS